MSDYYVAINGDDRNPGTAEAPWRTLGHAFNSLRAGDVLIMGGGVYHEVVRVKLAGQPGAPILIKAAEGERPILDGRAGVGGLNAGLPLGQDYKVNGDPNSPMFGAVARNQALLTIDGSQYAEINGLIIRGSMGRHVNSSNAAAAPMKNIIFSNCEFISARLHSIMFTNSENILFEDCLIKSTADFFPHAFRPRFGVNGQLQTHNAGVSLGGVKNITFRRVAVRNFYGEGIITTANNNPSDGILIEGCVFDTGFKSAVYVHAAANVTVRNNLIFRSAENIAQGDHYLVGLTLGNPIRVQSGEGSKEYAKHPTNNVKILNNIIVGTNYGITLAGSHNTEPVKNVIVAGNTIVAQNAALATITYYPENFTIRNNVFIGSPPVSANNVGQWQGSDIAIDHNAWSSAPDHWRHDTDVIGGDLLVDPDYRIPAGSGKTAVEAFNLLPTSAAIGAGLDKWEVSDIDYWGNVRDDPPSMGAIEPSAPPPPPSTKPDPPTLDRINGPIRGGQYDVTWEPVPGATEYRLQEQYNGGGWRLVYTGSWPLFFANRIAGNYCYRVRITHDGVTYSDWSNVECTEVVDPDAPPPEPPEVVTVRLEVGGKVWAVTATAASIHAGLLDNAE